MRCLLVLLFIVLGCTYSFAIDNSFIVLQVESGFSIHWPRDWENADPKTNKTINTSTDAILRMSGLHNKWGQNVILISSSYKSEIGGRVASLRLSVRPDKSASQNNMKEIKNLSRQELSEIMAPIFQQTENLIKKQFNPISYVEVNYGLVDSQNLTCFYHESEVVYRHSPNDPRRHLLYVCPIEKNLVKIMGTYNIRWKHLFRPIIEYVWQSLEPTKPGQKNSDKN